MRLLIFTQTVDRKDSALGRFHNWIIEIAKYFQHITIFALKTGEYDLPENVTVIPLRPWGYRARLRTVIRVIRLTWKYRNDYDVVLAHMNQEYLLVAGLFFKFLGKHVYMWRNHYAGNIVTDIAAMFCDKVFYTSKSSYTAKYKKAIQMPVGVEVDSCHLDESFEQIPHSVLFLGRFDTSKRPDLLVEALGKIAKEGIVFTATFVGGPNDPDSSFPKRVATRAEELGIADQISFVGPVTNTDTYRYYRSHTIYFNGGKSGMFDKSLFKSIACGCFPIFSSDDMAEIIGSEFAYRNGDVDDLAEHLKKALAMSEESRTALVREFEEKAIGGHTLPVLARRLYEEMNV
ncbi:MAG: glycosyltransferase [Candidatus Kaiserbacteria bacterium]|nr:glycosyltransferase [Candidatus Kaiserbacteria bacterium]